jgi:hypothetical protein
MTVHIVPVWHCTPLLQIKHCLATLRTCIFSVTPSNRCSVLLLYLLQLGCTCTQNSRSWQLSVSLLNCTIKVPKVTAKHHSYVFTRLQTNGSQLQVATQIRITRVWRMFARGFCGELDNYANIYATFHIINISRVFIYKQMIWLTSTCVSYLLTLILLMWRI